MSDEGRRRPPGRRGVPVLPTTRLGWWAVRLLAVGVMLTLSVVLFGIDGPDILGTLCALTGAVLGVMAILRERERAILVVVAVLLPVAAVAIGVLRVATED